MFSAAGNLAEENESTNNKTGSWGGRSGSRAAKGQGVVIPEDVGVYAFNTKATVEDEKLQSKVNHEDKEKILDTCNEVINGLDKNQTSGKKEFEHQQKAEEGLPLHR